MEIGSEFWDVPLRDQEEIYIGRETQFVLSGRTALELAALDLIAERKIRSICLPAYCCESMVIPFKKAGLKIQFYDVEPSEEGVHRSIRSDHGCDAVLLLDYFGFSQTETEEMAEREHKRGTAVILDRVQSEYSQSSSEKYADYIVTSWRKWFFSCAAAVTKRSGVWNEKPLKAPHEQYVSLRKEAAGKKAAWIQTGSGSKQSFLDAYARAEGFLDKDFSDYAADPESEQVLHCLNVSLLKRRRRENAEVLYKELKDFDSGNIRPLFPELGTGDVPLFVPVLVDPALRSPLRQWLIDNQVYCPVHWPDPRTGGGAALYAQELSLLCDQRYHKEEMKYQIQMIREFFIHHARHILSAGIRKIEREH